MYGADRTDDRVRVDDGEVGATATRGVDERRVGAGGCGLFERRVRGVRKGWANVERIETARERSRGVAREGVEGSESGGCGIVVRVGWETGVGGDVRGDGAGARR